MDDIKLLTTAVKLVEHKLKKEFEGFKGPKGDSIRGVKIENDHFTKIVAFVPTSLMCMSVSVRAQCFCYNT